MDEKIKESIKETLDIAIDGGSTLLGGILSDALVGQVVPGIATTFLSYKQKRTEKMLCNAIDQIKEDISKIKDKLSQMSKEEKNFITDKVIPIALESISKELQEEKVKFIVNGIKNVINNKITDEDIIIAYYDILNDLRMVDIKILINLYNESKKEIKICDVEKNIDITNLYEAVETHIVRKLENFCLITVKKTWGNLEGRMSKPTPDKLAISKLGTEFIEFFYMN